MDHKMCIKYYLVAVTFQELEKLQNMEFSLFTQITYSVIPLGKQYFM